tara:strand:- start:518 stop:946 length:429 start_codon:yes stop_codon:yes gene_type:complete
MRLSHVILGEILYYDPGFEKEVDKITDLGGKHLGSGDYGSAFLLNGRVYKVTTDEIELEHAQVLKGVKTNNFAFIYDVQVLEKKLGIIQMEVLGEFKGEIPEEWVERVNREAAQLGIDPDELDIRPSNIMVNQKNHLKLVDI